MFMVLFFFAYQDVSTHLIIEINSKKKYHNAEQIELIDLSGNVLVQETIQSNFLHSTLYATLRKFQPPVKSFFFYIRVIDIFLGFQV